MQFCYLEAISYIAKCTNCNIFPRMMQVQHLVLSFFILTIENNMKWSLTAAATIVMQSIENRHKGDILYLDRDVILYLNTNY